MPARAHTTAVTGCPTFTVPSGYEVSGFYGRAGSEVDKLGVFYAKVS
jgi:Jacalin-like lectin domain